jgi:hypothetical protein
MVYGDKNIELPLNRLDIIIKTISMDALQCIFLMFIGSLINDSYNAVGARSQFGSQLIEISNVLHDDAMFENALLHFEIALTFFLERLSKEVFVIFV